MYTLWEGGGVEVSMDFYIKLICGGNKEGGRGRETQGERLTGSFPNLPRLVFRSQAPCQLVSRWSDDSHFDLSRLPRRGPR